ncbi:MAG: quinone oxidoreductase [Thermoanaerobaculia bacterium]
MRAIRFHRTGGPEVLQLDEIPVPVPGPGEIRIALRFAGVNFIDTYFRGGLYDAGPLPARVGKEGAGVVTAVGSGVTSPAVGDRVAFWDATGSYADEVVLPAARALSLPAPLSFELGAALPLQGMTAHYLVHGIRPVEPGDTVLIHAAAGGVGLLATQLAKHAGARVFGTCSTPAKAALARRAGCDEVILYTETSFADAVLASTGGEGVDLTIDGVGQTTFLESVRATRVRGTVIVFGQSSGMIAPFSPRPVLGSRTLVSASLFDYARTPAELALRSGFVFDLAAKEELGVRIDSIFAFAAAGDAHRRLESRASSGKVLLQIAT